MTMRDPLISAALDGLPVPDHGPGFWGRLHARMSDEDARDAWPAWSAPVVSAASGAGSDRLGQDRSGGTAPQSVAAQSVAAQSSDGGSRPPRGRAWLVALAAAAAAVVVLVALVWRDDDEPDMTTVPTTTATPDPSTTEPDTTESDTTEPSTTTSTSSSTTTTTTTTTTTERQTPIPAEDLDAARDTVLEFLDALGSGDIDTAAAAVGPVSEEAVGGSSALRDLLQTATEGHGAWAAVADRDVHAIALDPGLAVVSLEGTLQVEGTVEHRIAVFPVRKAESADVWFVEPWTYGVGDPPLTITSPTIDAEELATSVPGEPLEVQVEPAAAGTAWASFDGGPAGEPVELTDDNPIATWGVPDDAQVVIVAYRSGATLAASGFRIVR